MQRKEEGGIVVTDLKALKEVVDDSGMTMVAIAEKTGITRTTLYNKLAGKGEFLASEIAALAAVLHMTNEQRDMIFFA